MKKIFSKKLRFIKKDIQHHKYYYLVFLVLIIIGVVLRVWRIDQLLGFYYDQGRDALVIQKILKGDLVLIGPTTGLEGVFMGPFYYYFLAPGYFFGSGSPVAAFFWQLFFVTAGYITVSCIGRFFFSPPVGLLSLFFLTFSFAQIRLDRWLSNPTPAFLFGPLTALFLIFSFKNPYFLSFVALGQGILMQLEASSAFFLLIINTAFVLVYRTVFGWKKIFLAALVFAITLVPQITFELKNNFLISKNLLKAISSNESGHSFLEIPSYPTFMTRLDHFAEILLEKISPDFPGRGKLVFSILLITILVLCIRNWKNPIFKVSCFWLFGLLFFFLLYYGNYGLIFDYYFIPVTAIFYIFFSQVVVSLWKFFLLKPVILAGLLVFLFSQTKMSLNYLSSGVDGLTTVAFGNQSQAIKYILNDAKENFNVDIFVPPVIPYSYDYLIYYYGKAIRKNPVEQQVRNLYTIHEVDTGLPKREVSWLKRQSKIGKILKEATFGGVRVEKRERY